MIVMRPSEGELHLAGNVGVLRMIYAVRTNRQRGRGATDNAGGGDHVNGAIGEMMLAKHCQIFWSGTIGTIKASADVGECYQVRATALRHGRLRAHPEDNDNQPFVLARILLPEVHLVGWLWGNEIKRPEHWRTDVPWPAYFAWPVRDMATLPDEATVRARQACG